MNSLRLRVAGCFCWSLVVVLAAAAPGAARPDIAPRLRAGELAAAEKMLAEHLAVEENDDLARFQLGTLQFVQAAEQLAQDASRYGAGSPRFLSLPFVRLGGMAGKNDKPEPVTYAEARAMLERFQESILVAEATLAPIQDKNLAWKLDLRDVRLDLNGDGERTDAETLGALFQMAAVRPRWDAQSQPPLDPVVGFDSADVYWLRGYSHLLAALADMILAYDEERLFDLTAHAVFANAQTEFAKRRDLDMSVEPERINSWDGVLDAVALVHLIDFELDDAARLKSAHEHLLRG